MANRLKPPKQKVDEEVLIEEKEETVEIKSLVKDERTHKILGSVLLFISFFLFVSFASFASFDHYYLHLVTFYFHLLRRTTQHNITQQNTTKKLCRV